LQRAISPKVPAKNARVISRKIMSDMGASTLGYIALEVKNPSRIQDKGSRNRKK
jgi:hypothetical protein